MPSPWGDSLDASPLIPRGALEADATPGPTKCAPKGKALDVVIDSRARVGSEEGACQKFVGHAFRGRLVVYLEVHPVRRPESLVPDLHSLDDDLAVI